LCRLAFVTLSRSVCVRQCVSCISLGGEGNALYPVLSRYDCHASSPSSPPPRHRHRRRRHRHHHHHHNSSRFRPCSYLRFSFINARHYTHIAVYR